MARVLLGHSATLAGTSAARVSGCRNIGLGHSLVLSVYGSFNNDPQERSRGARDSTKFQRIFTNRAEVLIPMSIPNLATVTAQPTLFEVDVALVAASAVISNFPTITVNPTILEVDVGLIAASANIVYNAVTAHPAILEVDVGLIAATALAQSPITATAALFEIDVALIAASCDAGVAPITLTPGRIFPLPPGRRVFPNFPTGRNKTYG